MAFTGVHIVCGRVTTVSGVTLLTSADWSESLSSPAATSRSAPGNGCVMRVKAAVDSYFAVGAAPDASQSPRYLVRPGETEDLFTQAGDRVAWIAA